MSYTGYGAFVYRDGERRPDKEDVGVFDTDEAALPSGQRIFANILKNREQDATAWWQHSQHGVMGDGPVRVACFKQGLGSGGIYIWPEGAAEPEHYDPRVLAGWAPPESPKDVPYENLEVWKPYWEAREKWAEYCHLEVSHFCGTGLYRFTFTHADQSESGHYEATMTEPDGTEWKCVYDCEYGAGHTDTQSKNETFQAVLDGALDSWFGPEDSPEE